MAPADAYMSDSDAFSWYMETDPLLRSTIVSVVVLDHSPDPVRLFDRIERASRMAPGFRHRVVQAPWRIANPRWVVDPDFGLAFHTRHLAVPAPGRSSRSSNTRARPAWPDSIATDRSGSSRSSTGWKEVEPP